MLLPYHNNSAASVAVSDDSMSDKTIRHSVTSLAETLDYIEDALRTRKSQLLAFDQLLLKLVEQKVLSYILVNNRDVCLETWFWSRHRSRPVF